MRFIFTLISLLITGLSSQTAHATESEKFVVYYSDKAPARSFNNYQLLVLDSRYHPPLSELSEGGSKTLLGYISLGEVEKTTAHFDTVKKNGLLFEENKNWKGSYGIDIRSPIWHKLVVENLVPGILRDGFDGIFIDTLDGPLELERANPSKYRGMAEATSQLIQAIRMHYPSIKIMVNRAYSALPLIAPYIEMELGESVFHTYNFDKKTYHPVSENDYITQVRWLQDAKTKNPKLKIYTLDYADKNDAPKIAEIYKTQRANGFIPYVTTISLTDIVEEGSVN